MGRYISIDDLLDVMPENMQGLLSNDKPNEKSVDPDVVNEIIETSEAEFEGFVQNRYKLPVIQDNGKPPALVKKMISIIARYYFYDRRQMGSRVVESYDKIIEKLIRIRSGKEDIPAVNKAGESVDIGSNEIIIGTQNRSDFDGFGI